MNRAGAQAEQAVRTSGKPQKNGMQALIVMAALVLMYFLQSQIRFMPSPLMEKMAADFGVETVTVGNLLSLCMVVSAVTMFVVSLILPFLGIMNVMALGLASVAVCGLVTCLSAYFPLTLFAYVFCGIAQGVLETIGVLLIAELFPAKRQVFFCGMLCAVSNICAATAYSLPNVLYEWLGSWRVQEFLWGFLAALLCLAVFLYGKKHPLGGGSQEKKEAGQGLIRALKNPFILPTVLTMILFIWVNNNYSIYMPLFLKQEKNFTDIQSGLAASFMFLCGFAGSVLAGLTPDRFRWLCFRGAPVCMFAGSLLLCLGKGTIAVYAGVLMFGLAYQMWVPVALASFMRLKNTDSAVLAGAAALFNGAGHFLTGFIPTVVGAELRVMRMSRVFLILPFLLLLANLFKELAAGRKDAFA